MRISDWSSDVCSSDLARGVQREKRGVAIVEDKVGAEILNRLILADRNAELDALLCIVDREFENALSRARHLRRNQHRRARDRFIENRCAIALAHPGARTSVVEGTRVSVRGELGWRP